MAWGDPKDKIERPPGLYLAPGPDFSKHYFQIVNLLFNQASSIETTLQEKHEKKIFLKDSWKRLLINWNGIV